MLLPNSKTPLERSRLSEQFGWYFAWIPQREICCHGRYRTNVSSNKSKRK